VKSVSTLREESREREAAPQTLRLLLSDVPRAGALLGLRGDLQEDAPRRRVAHDTREPRRARGQVGHHLLEGQGLVGGGDPFAHGGGAGGHQAVERGAGRGGGQASV